MLQTGILHSAYAHGGPSRGLTRSATARVTCKRRRARRVLHVAVIVSGFGECTAVNGAGEKEGRNEDENRFHGG